MSNAHRIGVIILVMGSFAVLSTGCGNSDGEGKRPDPATQVKGQKPGFAAPGAPPAAAPNAPAAASGAKAE